MNIFPVRVLLDRVRSEDEQRFYAAAVDLFQNKKNWKKAIGNGMKANFSWDRSAKKYMELYRSLME